MRVSSNKLDSYIVLIPGTAAESTKVNQSGSRTFLLMDQKFLLIENPILVMILKILC